MKSILLLALSITMLSNSCKKEKSPNPVLQLPSETQTGKNTFGCKINGEVWLPKGALLTTPAYDVQYYKSSGTLLIKTNRADKGQSLNIYLYGVYQNNDYTIHNPINNTYRYDDVHGSCQLYERTNSTQTGIVTITRLDTLSKVISGRFSGTLKQNGCPDINITEGRFDFEMYVFN